MRTIKIKQIDTPIGKMTIGATSKGICMCEYEYDERIEKHTKSFNKFDDYQFKEGENNHTAELCKQLEEYFNKERLDFDVKMEMIGTPFQKKVWKELLNVKYGEIRSYKQQAIAVGDVKAIRAVAKANGDNRMSIIIPCHRVIGSDGKLVGYGGSIWRKQYLLNLESGQGTLF